MKKNIIIFGGSGFIGYNLTKSLKKLDYNITSVSRKKPKNKKLIKGVKYIACDISKARELKKINLNFEYVVNLSGNIDHKNKLQTRKSHYDGCRNLINFFVKKKIKLFIQAGSSLEYGNAKAPHTEKLNCNPISHYGLAKLKATKLIKKTYLKKKFPFIVLRFYQIYGQHQKFDRLIPYVINASLKNKSFKCTEGNQLRDFLYIDDLINLFIKIFEKKNISYGTYNIGSGRPKKIRDIINFINKIIKKGKPLFGAIKMRDDESIAFYPNISKAKKLLGWKPEIDIFSGLKKTIRYYAK